MSDIEILERALRGTVAEWHAQPFAFFEADIQAVLYGRLREQMLKEQRFVYPHRLYASPAWAEPRELGRVACEAEVRNSAGNHRVDLVLWDAGSGRDYLNRHATAVVEIKCSLPLSGRFRDSAWAPLWADMQKVEQIVDAGAADWGISVMCVALPGKEGPRDPLPVKTALNGKCMAIGVVNTAPPPEIRLRP